MALGSNITSFEDYPIMAKVMAVILFGLHICASPQDCLASWGGPTAVISGSWGDGDNEFGIISQDTSDLFANFVVTSDGKIVARDGPNRRVKVYLLTGELHSLIPYRSERNTDITLAETYGFSGHFVGCGMNGANYSYRADQEKYIKFSPTGQVLGTYTERPAELGRVTKFRWDEDDYKITVEYPDKSWGIAAKSPFGRYMRDMSGKLYGVGSKNVVQYSDCGVEVARLTLPPDNIEEIEAGVPGIEPMIKVIEEYGDVVLGPNGDVYTWKRTETNYSILKWTWQDDRTAPTGIPEAPWGYRVSRSSSGLALKWVLPAQDPGCVTGYEIARSTTPRSGYSTIATVDKGVTTYEDMYLTAGTYYYKVRAMAGSDAGAYSDEVSGKF